MQNQMQKIQQMPEDVKRHIFTFGYVEHRKHMKKLCEKLQRDKVLQYNINVIVTQYNSGGISNMVRLLKEVDPDILEKLFNQCVRCNCCTKHCNKRPIYIGAKTLSVAENYHVECECRCRQMARMIERAYDYSDVGYAELNHLFIDQFV